MLSNGHKPGASTAPGQLFAKLLRPQAWEWHDGPKFAVWAWLPLAALVAVPFPMFGFPLAERGAPIFYLIVAGLLCGLARVSQVSWPYAALILAAGLRGAVGYFPQRTIQLMSLLLIAGFLMLVAREMPDKMSRLVAWGFVATAGYEVFLGLFNAFGVYPWMAWVSAEHVGKPMGMLTHPNYYGSFIALCLPIVISRLGIFGGVLLWLLLLKTVSVGPVLSAAAGTLVLAWPFFGPRIRVAIAGFGAAATVGVLTLHEWRLSGRREVWTVALGEMKKWPIIGQGLGEWRSWADQFNGINYDPNAGKNFFITLQAHNEPYQVMFELGLLGLLLALCLGAQAVVASRTVWRASPATMIPGPWYLFGRVPLERAWIAVLAVAAVNMFGSPTFHLPGQAVVALFALARVQADAVALSDAIPVIKSAVRRRRVKENVNAATC